MPIVVVAGLIHAAVGVKVKVTVAERFDGSKLLLVTPGPDQVPLGNKGSTSIFKFIGSADSQIWVVPNNGVCGVVISKVTTPLSKQELSGSKVILILPESPAGLKKLPTTP